LIQVRVTGKCSRISKRQVREAVSFYSSLIISRRLLNYLTVRVEFKNLWKTDKCTGTCCPEYDEPRPRDFIVEVNSEMSKKKILETLAHELVHMKQFAYGELKHYLKIPKTRFLDELFDNEREVQSDENYWFSPWEIESWGRQPGMYVLYKQYLFDKDNK